MTDEGVSDDVVESNETNRLRGASAAVVRKAVNDREPLPGTCGFAGLLSGVSDGDGPTLVRDVLGREPMFVDREAADPTEPDAWGFDPTAVADPRSVPAGTVLDRHGETAVWPLPTYAPADPVDGQRAVDEAVRDVLSDMSGVRCERDRVAVAFSGGVDSGLVATGVPDAPCYVAGFEESHDVAAAREAAAAMDRELRVVELTHDDLKRAIPAVADATRRRNVMDLNIAVPLYLAAEAATADGIEQLVLGQGADELFGGYSKVVEPAADSRVGADTVRGARTETVRTLPAQLERDVLTLRAAGVEPVTPLLDDRIVEAALRLPDELLATSEERKIALRRAAAPHLPESVAGADKKAVQYGTYVSREIDRLARQNGFKRRMDDHVGKYIDSLLDDV